jgi:RNA polymerase sigma-70 factor (ECF subfamily)
MPESAAAQPDCWEELQPLLDQELSRLPDKHRLPVVLCDLEGRKRREVAGQLQIPEGTISSRLTTARRLLAKRLARHGLAMSGGALATALSQEAASAGVPTSLVSSTFKAANLYLAGQTAAAGAVSVKVAALAEGVLKSMLLTRLKALLVGVCVSAVLGLGGGAFVWQSQAAEEAAQRSSTAAPSGDKDDDLKKTLLKLDELWWQGDPKTLGRLAADDLITVSPVGRYDKPALLAASESAWRGSMVGPP